MVDQDLPMYCLYSLRAFDIICQKPELMTKQLICFGAESYTSLYEIESPYGT